MTPNPPKALLNLAAPPPSCWISRLLFPLSFNAPTLLTPPPPPPPPTSPTPPIPSPSPPPPLLFFLSSPEPSPSRYCEPSPFSIFDLANPSYPLSVGLPNPYSSSRSISRSCLQSMLQLPSIDCCCCDLANALSADCRCIL